MNSRQLMLKLSAVMLCASTLILSGCGGGGGGGEAPTTTLSQSTIQLPTQVQVVSPK